MSGDIATERDLAGTLGDLHFEYVVNCGGYIDHAPYFKGGRTAVSAHFDGVLNLLDSLDREYVRMFVNIGSSDEYGDGPAPQVESQREAPVSPYSLGKLAATQLLQMLYRTEEFPAVTLRLFLTYGPGQDDRRFLPQIIKGCMAGTPFGTSAGEQLRDFCFIVDTVDAIFTALACPAAAGEVINIASGNPVSIREVVETVQRLVGGGAPDYGKVPYRPGENMKLYASIEKAKCLLGWTPCVDLRTGLNETIRWIQAQP